MLVSFPVKSDPVNDLDSSMLVSFPVKSDPVKEHLLNTLCFFITDAETIPPFHFHNVRVKDEPPVIEGDPNTEGTIIPEHVVPLVHIYGGYLVSHDLVQEELVRPPPKEGPGTVLVRALVKRSENHLLDKSYVIFCQPILSKHWHKVVIIDDEIQHVKRGLLVTPLVIFSGFIHEALP